MNESIDEASQFAKKYLEDLITFFGLNLNVEVSHDQQVIQLNIPSTQLNGFLIGQQAENMRSFQYLTGTVLRNNNYQYSRVNVDIADYKKQRAERLRERAEEWMKQVQETGKSIDLKPMNSAERRIIHQLAAEYNLSSESVGEGRERHIVLKK